MRRASGLTLSCLISLILLTYVTISLLHENKDAASRQYREDYREQGRQQVRAEAIMAGVAEMVNGQFVWKTNIAVTVSIENKIHQLIIEELERKDAQESESKD